VEGASRNELLAYYDAHCRGTHNRMSVKELRFSSLGSRERIVVRVQLL
jgi:hypothetical protein